MDSIQDKLFKEFAAISGQATSTITSLLDGAGQATGALSAAVQAVTQARTTAPGGASGSSSGGGSTADTVLSIASTVLKRGFGLMPVISGLLGLFGSGDSPAPPPLVKYAMPASIDFQAANTAAGIANADYDQSGMARGYRASAPAQEASSQGTSAPQITVNVQAMDARSFLDRSSDIAAAVRDAMLNLNSINDVVNDL